MQDYYDDGSQRSYRSYYDDPRSDYVSAVRGGGHNIHKQQSNTAAKKTVFIDFRVS